MKDQPIPIPLRQRWEDFKTAYLPILMFLALCACIVWMWGRFVSPPSVVGQVEAIHANLISSVPGKIIEFKADLLQKVTNGQLLATIEVVEPEVLRNELSAIEANLQLTKLQIDVDKTRNLDAYAQMRRALLTERLNLGLAKIRQTQVESEFTRAKSLYDAHLITAGPVREGGLGYEVAVRDRDTIRAEVEERTKAIDQMEKDLRQLEGTGQVAVNPAEAAIDKAIQAQIKRCESLSQCVRLYASMDGFVSTINHRAGEKVVAGAPILVISAEKTQRVIGWVRQPFSLTPKVGDVVSIRRPSSGPVVVKGTVAQVGTQLEPITQVLLPPNVAMNRIDLGIPFLVNLPADAKLMPGEPVVMTFPNNSTRLF